MKKKQTKVFSIEELIDSVKNDIECEKSICKAFSIDESSSYPKDRISKMKQIVEILRNSTPTNQKVTRPRKKVAWVGSFNTE